MSKDEFDSMMAKKLAQAKANESRPASDVLSDIPDDDEDMRKLMKLLDLKPIPANEVNLTKELLNK